MPVFDSILVLKFQSRGVEGNRGSLPRTRLFKKVRWGRRRSASLKLPISLSRNRLWLRLLLVTVFFTISWTIFGCL